LEEDGLFVAFVADLLSGMGAVATTPSSGSSPFCSSARSFFIAASSSALGFLFATFRSFGLDAEMATGGRLSLRNALLKAAAAFQVSA
jgi:hypothetical protein